MRSRALAGLVAAFLVLTAGCSAAADAAASGTTDAAAAVPVGSSSQTITVDGVERTFRVYRPGSLSTSQPVPLVVMIHGGGGSADQAEHSYGWDSEADSRHFVVAYPDGLDHAWAVGGGCCHFTGDTTVDDDVAFVGTLVTTVSRQLPIDPRRVYATGISEGGLMSYRLACQTTIFAAIGPDSATLLGDCPAPAAISVIHVHGTADTRIPYNGGPGTGVHHIDGPAVPALNATWRATDHCAAPSVTTVGVVTTSLATCPGGREVELITVGGAGHQWPGAVCNVRCTTGRSDPPSTALDATRAVWAFFAAHGT